MLIVTTVSPVYAAEPIKIASIFAFSGIAASSNRPLYVGVRYGVEAVNRRGGILGRTLSLVEIDNRSTPIGSKVAADQAVKQGVAAIIGASWSSHSLAIAKVAQANGVPMITTDSTNERVTRTGDYIFRLCFTDTFQGQVMARFAARELKAASAVVLINSASDYSIGLADVFSKCFKKLGGTVKKQIHYKHHQDNFRKEIEAVGAMDSDVLFIPGHDESAAIALEAVHAGIRGIPVGCDGWSTTTFLSRGGDRLPLGYYCAHWSEALQTEASRRFVETYKHRNGQALTAEPLGYDAVLLLADAIERAGSADPKKLRDALAATKGYDGVAGELSFNANGDPVKDIVVMKIDNGRPRYVTRVAHPVPDPSVCGKPERPD